MKNNIHIQTNFLTNFKPLSLNHFNMYSKIKKNNKQKYCKNFLIYLILFKYKNSFFKKSNIFIKKHKKKIYTILRSPYRHKLARHQIFLQRYNINFSLIIPIHQSILIKKFNKIKKLLFFLKKFNKAIESNLIYTNNINISIKIKYNNNFIFNFFRNNNKNK